MNRRLIFVFGALAAVAAATGLSRADEPAAATTAPPPAAETSNASNTKAEPAAVAPAPAASAPEASVAASPAAPAAVAAAPSSPAAEALRKAVSSLPSADSDEERAEHAALVSFYETRGYEPLWLESSGALTPKAALLFAEIKRADEWGLNPRDFALPAAEAGATPETVAAADVKISLAVLKYGRYARGGRIINPSEQLSSYLDRRPQLLKPSTILEGIAAAEQPDAYLRGLHPQHPQFERLRQKYVALLGKNKQPNAEAKKLLANMEEWRWMPADMGDLYVWNNVPEFTQRVVKDGKVVREVRIVAGQTDKQTPIFTRPLRKITFKPTWIVPDSIKVHEIWPSLLRGGGMLREWSLEVRTKEGQPVNWRKIDWSNKDIRQYEVIQPNGPKSVMGKVKFSFPSQHTVFMHDTLDRDRWMFQKSQRTYSHGCMRVANPIGLAEIVLREDKGWDAARVREALNTGLNNEIPVDRKVMVHMTYFTALVGDDGKVHTYPDVYGHERRITQALEGKWDQINKGRNHLAPVELNLADARPRRYAEDEAGDLPAWRQEPATSSFRGSFLDLFGYGR